MAQANHYDADSISVLEGLEACGFYGFGERCGGDVCGHYSAFVVEDSADGVCQARGIEGCVVDALDRSGP